MKIHFLTFASSKFYKTLKRIEDEAIQSCFFDTVTCVKEKDLPLSYRIKNIRVLNRFTTGFGYWMWKSYVTKIKLAEIAIGDVLVYVDAGSVISKEGKERFDEYISMLTSSEYSNLSFQMLHPEKKYTKGDLFKYFGVENNEIIKNGGMLNAGTFLLRKDKQSLSLIEEWYSLCHTTHLINGVNTQFPNDPEFISPRYDQSIFSLLRKLRGSLIIPDESFHYNWSENQKFPIHMKRLKF